MRVQTALIIAAAVVPLSVSAADTGTSMQQSSTQEMFNKLDTNQDGYISKDEAKADTQLSQGWKDADVNKDGRIEESEFSAFEVTQEPASGGMGTSSD